jgi:hypothetical protein
MMLKSHKDWMDKTNAGAFSTRSRELAVVDTAVQAYFKRNDAAHKQAALRALEAWQLSKTKQGKNWKNSNRNKNGAVTELHNHLNDTVDQAALAAVDAELARKTANVEAQFQGKQITWKNEFRGKLNSNLVKPHSKDFALYLPVKQLATSGSTNKFGTAGNTAGAAMNSAALLRNLLHGVVPVDQQAAVIMEVGRLVPHFSEQLAASCAPFAGIATSGGITLWNMKNTYKSTKIASKGKVNLHHSMAGKSGTKAIESLIEALVRERNADIYSLSASAAELGGKIASLALDGGMATNTAISLTANILKLLNIARIVYKDMQEKTAANMALRGRIDISIFETSPLVGCYWLNIAPNNVMLSGIYGKIGNVNWQDDAHKAHKSLSPLREAAREVISHHRFEIVELNKHPGGMLMKQNLTELSRMKENVGKGPYAGFGSSG